MAPILGGRDLIVQAENGSGKGKAVLAQDLERATTSGLPCGVLRINP